MQQPRDDRHAELRPRDKVELLSGQMACVIQVVQGLLQVQAFSEETINSLAVAVRDLGQVVVQCNAHPTDSRNSMDLMHIAMIPVRARIASLEQAVARMEKPHSPLRWLWGCLTRSLRSWLGR